MIASGCCLTEGRVLDLEWEEGRNHASVSLHELRGASEGQYLMWHVRTPLPPGALVTEVSLRQGTPTGELLYWFPLENAVPYADVITQVFSDEPYERAIGGRAGGALTFDQLWARLQSGQSVFIHVRFADGSFVNMGPLPVVQEVPWQDALCT